MPNIVVIVTSANPGSLNQGADQEKVRVWLRSYKLVFEEVDAVAQAELRKKLQAICKKTGGYPWVFIRSGDSPSSYEYTFKGDFEEMQKLIDCNDLTDEQLEKLGAQNFATTFSKCEHTA